MSVSRVSIPITAAAWGGGTALSSRINGEILSVRMAPAGTALTGTGGTCALTITCPDDGGTICAGTVGAAPFKFQPRDPLHTRALGTTAYALGVGPVVSDSVPVLGTIQVVVANAAPSGAGTVEIIYRR